MAILSNIKLKINVGLASEYEIRLNFFEDIKNIDFQKDIIKIKEYHYVNIVNHENKRLYFDGFDVLEANVLLLDENKKKYLYNGEIALIDSVVNSVLVPGYYLFKIVGEKEYYSIIEIVPKEFEYIEWKKIYKEIELFSSGLSHSFENKNNAKTLQTNHNSNFYEKINYLMENYRNIIHALNLIKNTPRHVVTKQYEWVNKNAYAPIDKNSIKYYSKSPHMKNYLYSYKRKINYNISENIWLKTQFVSLLREINNLQAYINNVNEDKAIFENIIIKNKKIKFNKSAINKKIIVIRNIIINILREDWMYAIEENKAIKPSKGALMDYSYNTIFKLINEFNKTELSLVFSKVLQNCWKRTDELYEIWCFIKVLTQLTENNFEPIEGWIYGQDAEIELYEGTIVKLKKENVQLNIHYNSIIKGTSASTSEVHPLYTNNKKNKPDIRIDIFINNIYLKSIPIDVKYRRLKNITDKYKGALEQLFAYKNNPSSKYHLIGAKEYKRKNHRIINKVIVLFPRDEESSIKTTKLKREHGIEFYEFSPSFIDKNFLEMIEDEVRDMKELYEDAYEN